jgi:hypothetical protein
VPTSSLLAAIASISSIRTIDGAFLLAKANNSLTILAPSPINFCANSEATNLINVALVSPATA